MRFLRRTDYYRLIQPNDLTVLLGAASDAGYDPDQLLIDLETGSMEIMQSYMLPGYDITRIFSDTSTFDPAVTYYAESRVQYHEPAYDATVSYTSGARMSYNGSIYQANTTTTIGPFIASQWTFLCLDYALFYALKPYPEFQDLTNYPAGTTVWAADNYTYTSLKDTKGNSLNNAIYSEYGADKDGLYIPPSQTIGNADYWQKNSPIYSFIGILPTDGTKWALGDNRSHLMVEAMIDVTLFKLFSAISPRNIPELRFERYKKAISWLKDVAAALITANLPTTSSTEGLVFTWNIGAPKMINTY